MQNIFHVDEISATKLKIWKKLFKYYWKIRETYFNLTIFTANNFSGEIRIAKETSKKERKNLELEEKTPWNCIRRRRRLASNTPSNWGEESRFTRQVAGKNLIYQFDDFFYGNFNNSFLPF